MTTRPEQLNAGQRIAILVSLVIAGVALSSNVHLPSWQVEFNVLGSPLSVGISGAWLLAFVLVAITAAGTSDLVRAQLARERIELSYTATFWILPCLVTLAAAVAVPRQFDQMSGWLGSVVLLGTLLAAVVVGEYNTIDVQSPHYRLARVGLNIATYAAALALYSAIYGLQVRSLLSATAVLLVTFPLALELLRGTEEQLTTTWAYAGIIALVSAELTWALNRWGLTGLAGGGLLLIAFYTLSGVSQQHLAGRLNRRVALEFATIGLLGVVIIWLSSPWLVG
jgi:hypothetical protein